MNSEGQKLQQDIIHYYETCDTDYAFFWHLKSRMAMHYGYWNSDTKNLREALWNMNDFLAAKAGIGASDFVLDAGCGIGGSCFYLSEKTGCKTHGITLSKRHADEANAVARSRKMEAKVSFSTADFCRTNFPDAHFDCVWALESVCHALNKMEFVSEAFRILKPAGRLVVGDFFQKQNLSGKEAQDMQRWADSWAVPFFESAENFEKMLITQGFMDVQSENIDKHIQRSSQILNRYFIPGLLSNWLMPIFGKRKSRAQQLNVWSVYLQRITFRRGSWNYVVFSAKKPI